MTPDRDPGAVPVRVMHVVQLLALAGMEYGVMKLLNRLDRGRFEPSIACLHRRHPSSDGFLDPAITVVELHKKEGRDYPLIARLAKVFRRHRVDVVHSHNWQTFFHTVLAARLAGVPVVLHGEHGRETKTRPESHRSLQRYLARSCHRVTTVCVDLADEIVATWGIPPEQVVPIANGVELERFDADAEAADVPALLSELGIPPGAPLVTNVGGIRPVKDHRTLVRAFARVAPRFPEARLVVVGGGDRTAQARRELAEYAGSLGVGERVFFTGLRKDIPSVLLATTVYVNSSLYEGMSNTILEAMAARRPVIATRVGGNPELVVEGETGFLVPSEDDVSLSDRIAAILGDPELRQRLGEAARARVERAHTMDRMVGSYSDLYENSVLRHRLASRMSAGERAKRVTALAAAPVVRRRSHRGHLTVLMYHRVLPLSKALRYPFPGMVMGVDHFEAQISRLSRKYAILPLSEAVPRLRHGSLPDHAVAVTFDDGYKDNLEYALPVLRRHRVPATLFVVSGAVLDGETLWWDEVAWLVYRLAAAGSGASWGSAEFPELLGFAADLKRHLDSSDTARRLVETMNGLPAARRAGILEALRRAAPTDEPVPWPMMGAEGLREMRRGGIEIGAHTVTQAFVDELDETAVEHEIDSCSRALEGALGERPRHFAYPRGRAGAAARSVLVRLGFEAAFTTAAHPNDRSTDPMALGRLDAGWAAGKGPFSPAVFDLEVRFGLDGLRRR